MENDTAFIGDIKHSLLEPGTFTSKHPGWVLLAGQAIDTGSQLGLLGFINLPDARGVFLRGMNEGRGSDTGDADGNRAAGLYQGDEFRNHSHKARVKFRAALNFDAGEYPPAAQDFDGTRLVDGGSTAESGGSETRPRNIAVYIYIKIS